MGLETGPDLRMRKVNDPIQRRRRETVKNDLGEVLPTGVQKSYFMLSDPERAILNTALEKYQPGQSEPISVDDKKVLKPALRLMAWYRLAIEEIKEATSRARRNAVWSLVSLRIVEINVFATQFLKSNPPPRSLVFYLCSFVRIPCFSSIDETVVSHHLYAVGVVKCRFPSKMLLGKACSSADDNMVVPIKSCFRMIDRERRVRRARRK